MRMTLWCGLIAGYGLFVTALSAAEPAPDYEREIAPLLKKYCAGCHNADELAGEFSLESFADLLKGGASGPAVVGGDAGISRLVRMMTGRAKPQMPPKDQPQPTPEDIAIIRSWIDAGARGPAGEEPRPTTLTVPMLQGTPRPKGITSVSWSPDGELLAVARTGEVQILKASDHSLVTKISDLPGKVNGVRFSRDGQWLAIAAGIPGLTGEARLWHVADRKGGRVFRGHRDAIYAAELSPDGTLLATGSYDKQILLWNAATGEQIRSLKGHNDAVYDLAFNPAGTVLASASGDQTIKLWQVSTGTRLDTLGQPLKEQYVTTWTPDGEYVLGAGVDNRIRVWKLLSDSQVLINPIQLARFAHEGPIVQLAFSRDGSRLLSVSEDRTLKLWETKTYTELAVYERQPAMTSSLAWSPQGDRFVVGRLDGSLEVIPLSAGQAAEPSTSVAVPVVELGSVGAAVEAAVVAEQEPNDLPEAAQQVSLPAKITGKIFAAQGGHDADVYAFHAQAGERWVFEVNAARNKSSLDSRLEILDEHGQPVPRQLFQAVRDSYVTFRGIDSTTRDCRLHNWEEMKLNEYVWLNGEVVKLFLAPRGPDSGFSFYPHEGNRECYFDTTAISHALNEPCYTVVPQPVGSALVPNGLPVFTLYYENDDDGLRRWGSDSRLNFTAPATGRFLVRMSDVRGFQGENYNYELTGRRAQPGFHVTLNGANPTLNVGSGKEFTVVVDRTDGFEGEIRVDLKNIPTGFSVTTPLVIQAGQRIARGVLNSYPSAQAPGVELCQKIEVTAIADVEGREVTQSVNNFGEIKLADKPKIYVQILPSEGEFPASSTYDLLRPVATQELTIHPGQTITAKVRIERNGYEGRVQFEAIAQNLPHGVIIDNIGLNGLMIVEGQTERTFFITAAEWVPEATRMFHLRSQEEGQQATWPMLLHIRHAAGKLAGQ